MDPNDKTFPVSLLSGTILRVVDFPGHARLRSLLPPLIQSAAKIVFLVDANAFDAIQVRELSDLMYDVFTECIRCGREPDVLIALNKSELEGAIDPTKVRSLLEKELDTLKTSRHTMETEGNDELDIILGSEGQAFDFNNDAGCDVDFCKLSVKTGDLDPLIDFIQ